ncbi:hypothetical protein [Methanosphaera cuniculi]|uniref:Uncharacterized protein n=1 Tax=Methanosphaera cuniculi TaxID=1077256 RepID=A0A2A2HE06_9EURY|nr:hypothetical protein [Methanosphaera cuniculi]PAV07536.1 hypothetical protein ASJ82_07620 [Methanosphaera cuniculi]PWL08148.1 hypothetical protein MSCUN_10790 [Methanosphaera cuniculi]
MKCEVHELYKNKHVEFSPNPYIKVKHKIRIESEKYILSKLDRNGDERIYLITDSLENIHNAIDELENINWNYFMWQIKKQS